MKPTTSLHIASVLPAEVWRRVHKPKRHIRFPRLPSLRSLMVFLLALLGTAGYYTLAFVFLLAKALVTFPVAFLPASTLKTQQQKA